MKRFVKMISLALLLTIPSRIWAQEYRDYENGFLFSIFNIANVEERVQLASALATSDIWLCNPTDNPGELFIRPNSYNADIPIYAEFDYLRMTLREEYEEISLLPKEEFEEIFSSWTHNISNDYYNFLISDYLDRANHCLDAEPFCTSDVYNFPALNSGYSWSGPNYGCLGGSPTSHHSFWYYMRIGVAGNITIKIQASFDVDFALWGPFSNETDPCPTAAGQAGLLTANCSGYNCPNNTDDPNFYPSGNLHDCSFDARHYEYAHIVNGQVGQYFILLITNWAGGSGNITFQKYAGDGETDCGILPGVASNDGPYCVGETIHLSVNAQDGATYSWSGPGGFTSNQQNPNRPNCTMNMAGTYTCITTVGNQSTTATTNVEIYPQPTANFSFTSVCVGNATSFTSTSTTNPPGQQINNYSWNFGDGQTGQGQNVTHTYTTAGTYQATLTVSTGGHCTSQITKAVTVYDLPSSSFTFNTVCQGTATQFTSTASSAPGNPITNYQWDFGDGQTGQGQTVNHTYAQAGTYQVTHTVQANGSCSNQITQSVTVNLQPTPTASATPNTVIYGGTASLTANAGTPGSFSFHWEPANKVVNPNSQTTQTVQLTETTTYTCTVTNPQGDCTGSTQVTVAIDGSNMSATANADQNELCEGESTSLHAQPAGGTGNYTYSWSPSNTLNNPNIQNPIATPPLGTTTYTCQVSDGYTNQNISVSITVHPHVESNISASICPDDTYNFFGNLLSQEGIYDHTIPSQYGCDSTIHLHLTHYETYETPITRHYCKGDSYSFYGQELNSAGVYYHTLETVHGCDSVIKLNLIEDPSYEYFLVESTCEGGPGFLFDGEYLQPSNYPYIIAYETVSGCDSLYFIHVNQSEYNSKSYNVSICATEYTWGSNGITYYESGTYYDTLQYADACDSTLVLNLELRPSFNNEVVETNCDSYRWKSDEYNVDMTFDQSTTYTHHYTNIYGCESEATLFLTINKSNETITSPIETCDEYTWDPEGHEIVNNYNHEGIVYNATGDYKRQYKNQYGCDSIVHKHMDFEYTPQPSEIYPVDANNINPHWVITATEFQINSYDFSIWEAGHPATCHWDSITWAIENPNIVWFLEPDQNSTPPGKTCKMYVLNHIEDTVWLDATVYNRCSPQGETQRYWFISSFYGIDEEPVSNADFNVIPNPNNGTMKLNFENLTGKIDLKIYDMRGVLIDQLSTYSIGGPETMLYDMKHQAEGIYFFVATGKEGSVAKKVVIKR